VSGRGPIFELLFAVVYATVMKKLQLLFLPAIGFALFLMGWLLPQHHPVIRYALMIPGVLFTLSFYFITLSDVIRKFSAKSTVHVFWLVAILCAPVIGNIIYVIFREMADHTQQPHGMW